MILSNDITSAAQVREAVEIMEEAGSIEYARQRLTGLVEEANEQLKALPETPHRMALEELAYFIINRTI